MSTVTVQTLLRLNPALPEDALVLSALGAMAEIFGRAERLLHAGRMRGGTVTELKKTISRTCGLTARHFNGVRFNYDGKLGAARDGQRRTVQRLERQGYRNTERLKEVEEDRGPEASLKRHGLTRRGVTLKSRLKRARAERATAPSLCFGGAKLFRAQHHLRENGFPDHAAWRAAWVASRSSQINLVGSKDETAGNQSAQYDPVTRTLRLRLPDAVAADAGLQNVVVLSGVQFNQDPDLLPSALARGVAISYKIVRKAETTRSGRPTGQDIWYVNATTERVDAPVDPSMAAATHGALGIDFNADHLAWTRVDASGNPVDYARVDIRTRGRRRNQIKDDLSVAVARIVDQALAHGVPIALEDLDFTKKKDRMRGAPKERNRVLSSMTTRLFSSLVHSRAARAGVAVILVNPAFTSEIGQGKYSAGYGLSRDLGAGVAIARRGIEQCRYHAGRRTPSGRRYRMRERLLGRSAGPGSARSACALPERNRARHVWSDWGRVAHARVQEASARHRARQGTVTRGRPPAGTARRGKAARSAAVKRR